MATMLVDLHVHSSVSDGTTTPTRLVFDARSAGLDVIGLTDHDTFDGIAEAAEAGRRVGVQILPGIEISSQRLGRSVHLLGYGCDMRDPDLLAELALIREGRNGRIQGMLDRLAAMGMPLEEAEVRQQAGSAPSIGRPHVADAMVARGYVGDRTEAFELYLADDKPAYVKRYSPDVSVAIALVRKAKGLAVVAHPWGRGMADVLTAETLADLAEEGLEGIEVDHPDHDDEARALLSALGARLGLIRTGSSDHHGEGKRDHPLGANHTRPTAYREILKRLGERGGVLPR